MKTENSLLICDFPNYVILEYSSGGAEFAQALPETARPYCVTAARFFETGRSRTARDICTGVLKHALPASLAKKLKYFTIPELAQLAAYLLDVKFSDSQVPEESISAQALEKSIKRLKEKIR